MDAKLMETLISIFIGALVTWAAASYYYRKASKELEKEASELRRLNSLMLLGMEHAGWIRITRDNSGKILGFEQTISVGGIRSEEAFGKPAIVMSTPKTNT
jgi:hypothetical protein